MINLVLQCGFTILIIAAEEQLFVGPTLRSLA
jgi:hypothetical protein